MRVEVERPIVYGPHMMKDTRAEKAIRFLEDPQNADKPIPPGLLLEDELDYLTKYGRLACAKLLREDLQGGIIG